MAIEFERILKMYCGDNAIALELKEEDKYRGCKVWTFKRRTKKWRWNRHSTMPYLLKQAGTKSWKWTDIPDTEKESYISEFWMALTNYELEFEMDCEEILSSQNREEASYRIQYQIDKQYAEANATNDIM